MFKKIIFILAIAVGLNSVAQTKYSFPSDEFVKFHLSISSAERMFKNDSLLQAYGRYDIAINGYNGSINAGHYFKAALCALKIKEEIKALSYLGKAIKNGYEVDSMYADKIAFFNQNTKNEFDANYAKWMNERDAAKNTNWENELYASVQENKKFTTVAYQTAISYCNNCMKTKSCSKTATEFTTKYRMVKEKRKADSITALNLLEKIKANGFPNMKLMDKKACAIAHNILLNYDNDKTNTKLNDILFKALTDGFISPAFYASVVDRRNLLNGLEPEFYEPVMGYEKTIGTGVVAANKRRNKIGLYNIIMPNFSNIKPNDLKNQAIYNNAFVSLYDY